MAADPDKTVEILVSEVGDMTIVLRPSLPFLAEGYRIDGASLEVFGQERKISLEIPEELREDASETTRAILLEYGHSGSTPERETDLLKEVEANTAG
jgi:hypothetical protein